MSDPTKLKHLKNAKKLVSSLKHPEEAEMLRFFSDQENFDQDQKSNMRNDRGLCKDPNSVAGVMHTKSLSTVMVLSVISSEGDVLPAFFFQKGPRVIATVYMKVLEDTMKP